MLEKSVGEECWKRVLEKSVVEKCWRSAVEKCCREVLEKSVVEKTVLGKSAHRVGCCSVLLLRWS